MVFREYSEFAVKCKLQKYNLLDLVGYSCFFGGLEFGTIHTMQNHTPKKSASILALTSVAVLGLSSLGEAQELFGSYSDYAQSSGYDLQEDALADSDRFELFKFGVRTGFTFDDNIFLTKSNEESDVIFTTDLILSLKNKATAENSWVLTYIPSFKFYADNSSLDGVDHNVNAGFTKTWAKSVVELGADFASITGSNRYAAGQIDKNVLGADILVSHIFTGKTRADLTFDFRGEDFENNTRFVDRNRYTTRLSGFYQWSGKVNIGPYVGYEYISVDNSPDHKAVSLGASFEYQALAKTSFSGFLGGESRTFTGNTMDDATSMVYNIGGRHQFSGKTSFNASFYRRVNPSYTNNTSSFTATGAYLGSNYRATERINLRGRLNYAHDSYFGQNASGLDSDYFSISLGGDYAMMSGLKLGADVTFRTKDSDNASNFDNTLIQLNASYYF